MSGGELPRLVTFDLVPKAEKNKEKEKRTAPQPDIVGSNPGTIRASTEELDFKLGEQ